MIVLDTNVLSEVLRPSPSAAIIRWLADQEPLAVFITAVTQAEVLCGVEAMPAGKRRTALRDAVEQMLSEEFQGRILPFDEVAARVYAKIVSDREAIGRPISQFDAMIAAIASAHRAAVATRNVRDFEQCGLRLINPWEE
jgi:predicted nucleic acid-binding protein